MMVSLLVCGSSPSMVAARGFTLMKMASVRSSEFSEVHRPLDETEDFGTLFDFKMLGGRCVGVKLPDFGGNPMAGHPFEDVSYAAGASNAANGTVGGGSRPRSAGSTGNTTTTTTTTSDSSCPLLLLHADEWAYAAGLGKAAPAVRFAGGRLALRRAMGPHRAAALGPVLKGARGEPLLGAGVTGSISHKDAVAVGLVASARRSERVAWEAGSGGGSGSEEDASPLAAGIEELPTERRARGGGESGRGGGTAEAEEEGPKEAGPAGEKKRGQPRYLGVDVENLGTPRRVDLLRRKILTRTEQRRLGALAGVLAAAQAAQAGAGDGEGGSGGGAGARGATAPRLLSEGDEVLLAFSLKEAAYKALHPLLRRHVGWHEVEVRPRPDGSCAATFHGNPAGWATASATATSATATTATATSATAAEADRAGAAAVEAAPVPVLPTSEELLVAAATTPPPPPPPPRLSSSNKPGRGGAAETEAEEELEGGAEAAALSPEAATAIELSGSWRLVGDYVVTAMSATRTMGRQPDGSR